MDRMSKAERMADREIKAMDLTAELRTRAQANFIKKMAKEEGVDYHIMLLRCQQPKDPEDFYFSLGYKMSNPVYMMAMNLQKKENRSKAIENFKKELCPEELKIFESEVQTENMRTNFKKEIKSKTKKNQNVCNRCGRNY